MVLENRGHRPGVLGRCFQGVCLRFLLDCPSMKVLVAPLRIRSIALLQKYSTRSIDPMAMYLQLIPYPPSQLHRPQELAAHIPSPQQPLPQ